MGHACLFFVSSLVLTVLSTLVVLSFIYPKLGGVPVCVYVPPLLWESCKEGNNHIKNDTERVVSKILGKYLIWSFCHFFFFFNFPFYATYRGVRGWGIFGPRTYGYMNMDTYLAIRIRLFFPSFSLPDVQCQPTDLIWREETPFEALAGSPAFIDGLLAEVHRGFPLL